MTTAAEKIDEILRRRPELLSKKYTEDLDELILKFPKVVEDVKLGKFKSINQIVGFVVKNDKSIDAQQLHNAIFLKIVGREFEEVESLVVEIPKKLDMVRIEPINESYKVGNDYYLKVLYRVDEEVVDFNKLTELQLTKPNILRVKRHLDSLIITT